MHSKELKKLLKMLEKEFGVKGVMITPEMSIDEAKALVEKNNLKKEELN